MSSELAHRVESGATHPVVRITGVLDGTAGDGVRGILLDVLADDPEAVVVDVSDLRVADPAAPAALRDVARDTAEWPGAHLVLAAGSAHTDVWRGTGLPIWPDPAAALAELGEPEPGARLAAELEPALGAARKARELITEACGRWEHPELAGPGCIVVTEMVNNVVAHAKTPMTVLVSRRGDAMRVAVRDSSATIPRFTGAPVPATSYGGRGLLLIDSVSSRWGSLALAAGKVVWAVLESEPEDSAPVVHRAGMAGPRQG